MVTQEILKNSIEVKWRKYLKNIYLIIGVVILVFSLLFLVPTMITDDFSWDMIGITMLSISPLFVIFLSIVIYYVFVYKKTCTVLDDYKIYEVVLDQPSSYMYRGSFYYSITFITEEKDRITIDTPPMFGNGFLTPCSIEDYNNQKVYVAYSKQKDKTVILGRSITEDN